MILLPAGYELRDGADPVAAHAYLTHSYWSPGIVLAKIETAIENSLCVSIYFNGEQVAMARVVSDYSVFAYLADVYVLKEHRSKGLAHAMLLSLQAHPRLQGLRRWILFTRDAHEVYARTGWQPLDNPERAMKLDFPDAFK
ncbi:GNAT family N-acetyltransferase [Sphingorhabdus arenilitoris]|uniref:GNAT family N-acetyltransferase n=1 Tax=Sphingorhabdus arenilitoris TaxID=1490041 RepID=A0ABV8RK48_9SPHN